MKVKSKFIITLFNFYYSRARETIESAVAKGHFIFVRDTRDMKIMSMPLIPGQIRSDAHLSLFEADLYALIKRRFVPHGSCVNAIFPRQPFERIPALVTSICANLTKSTRRSAAIERGRGRRKVRISDFASQSRLPLRSGE